MDRPESTEVLSEKELNVLASKLVKAEIMGKVALANQLKQKLQDARKRHETSRKRKIETHHDCKRMRYFAADDKYSLQQRFQTEKYTTVHDQNKECKKMADKVRNNDLGDIFADNNNNRRKKESDSVDKRHVNSGINEHKKVARNIDNSCRFCIQGDSMQKHLVTVLGESVFLCVPPFEPLTKNHCLILPIKHVTSSTLLDENVWAEVVTFKNVLTRMYKSKNKEVIFFETSKNRERYPHMFIECVPIDKEEGEAAPIYFKKAIEECEVEWAQNKKLVSLNGRDVRKAIPKGLPYFSVSFGLQEGYAHVIEDENSFPENFAQEIIGGMLDLHPSKWRNRRNQSFEEQSRRAIEFSKEWNA